MNVRFSIIGLNDALANREFIMPWVIDRKDFSEYTFYAAIVDERLAGILVADKKIYEPEILSIGVSPEFQGKGIGSALLEYAEYDILSAYGDEEAETDNRVIAYAYGEADTIAPVRRIFEKSGFTSIEKGHFVEATLEMLMHNKTILNPKVVKDIKSSEYKGVFRSLKDMDQGLVKEFGNFLMKKEIVPGINIKELEEDISVFGLKEGKIVSCILFGKERDGIIQNLCLYNSTTGLESGSMLLHLLAYCGNKGVSIYPPETKINIWTGNKTVKKIVDEIFPEAPQKQIKMEFELLFSDVFGDASQRFSDDIEFEPVVNDKLMCANCRHCTNSVISCEKYLQKPSPVLDGAECKLFESK